MVDLPAEIIHYKPIKVIINSARLVKVIINVIVWYHGLPDSIMTNKNSSFTSNFWLLLCFFLAIKHWLFIAFYLQINDLIKR